MLMPNHQIQSAFFLPSTLFLHILAISLLLVEGFLHLFGRMDGLVYLSFCELDVFEGFIHHLLPEIGVFGFLFDFLFLLLGRIWFQRLGFELFYYLFDHLLG